MEFTVMTRHVHYGILPVEARTLPLPINGNPDLLEIDIASLAATGMREVIETARGATALQSMLNDLLTVETPLNRELRWAGDGLGIGSEMKRGFSAILGRFFARWYLETHHGLVNFVPINGDGDYTVVHQDLVIGRTNVGQLLPDWVCVAQAGGVLLAEAKGRHDIANWLNVANVTPLNKAVEQLGNAWVALRPPGGLLGPPELLETKGWAVMSRWATEANGKTPLLYAHDPSTSGRAPTAGESERAVSAVRRSSLARTLEALDHPVPAEILSPRLNDKDLRDIEEWVQRGPQSDWIRRRKERRSRSSSDARNVTMLASPRLDSRSVQPRQAFSVNTEALVDKRYIGSVVDVTGRPISTPASDIIRASASGSEGVFSNLYFAGVDTAEIEAGLSGEFAGSGSTDAVMPVDYQGPSIPIIRTFGDGFVIAPIGSLAVRDDGIGAALAGLK